jgi:Fic family protein
MNLMEITKKINRLSEELEKLRPLKIEDEQRVMQKFRLDWNYNSNNIEGNTLTYGETKALILFGITAQGKPLKDHLEIEGHNEAIDYIVNVARNKEPLTEALIRNLHKMILREPYEIDAVTIEGRPTKKIVRVGEYKTTPNYVKTVTGETFYYTSPEDTPAKMEELMKWYKENQNNKKIHPLMFAVEFHHRFIRIHPFDDGNGRVVRLLMNLLLMQKGLPPVIIKTKEKEDYYRVLQQADAGNLEPFYTFAGEGLIHTLELMINAAKGKEIEEPDDVDKEIALLKEELKNKEEIKALKSAKTLKKVLDEIIPTFSLKVLGGLKSITELFLNNNLEVHFGNTTSTASFVIKNAIETDLTAALLEKIVYPNLERIDFIVNLINFKKKIDNPFDFSIKLSIKFGKYFYWVTINNEENTAKKLYHQTITDEEFKLISQKSKKIILEYIKGQLNK